MKLKISSGKYEKNNLCLNYLEVYLPKTTLYILEGYGGFAMCGALDVNIYNSDKLKERKVLCMKALGVRSIDDLFDFEIKEVTKACEEEGIYKSMKVWEGFKKLSKKE